MGGEEVGTSLMWNFTPMGSRMSLYIKRDAGLRDNFKNYLMIKNFKCIKK